MCDSKLELLKGISVARFSDFFLYFLQLLLQIVAQMYV